MALEALVEVGGEVRGLSVFIARVYRWGFTFIDAAGFIEFGVGVLLRFMILDLLFTSTALMYSNSAFHNRQLLS